MGHLAQSLPSSYQDLRRIASLLLFPKHAPQLAAAHRPNRRQCHHAGHHVGCRECTLLLERRFHSSYFPLNLSRPPFQGPPSLATFPQVRLECLQPCVSVHLSRCCHPPVDLHWQPQNPLWLDRHRWSPQCAHHNDLLRLCACHDKSSRRWSGHQNNEVVRGCLSERMRP